jgi:hypothetical protein
MLRSRDLVGNINKTLDVRVFETDANRRTDVSDTVTDMTKDELRKMIGELIEEKLVELLGDPDEGLVIRDTIKGRLQQQMKNVAAGDRGEPLEDVVQRLGLE